MSTIIFTTLSNNFYVITIFYIYFIEFKLLCVTILSVTTLKSFNINV